MGYTHYWSFCKPKGSKVVDLEKTYQAALVDCRKVIKAWQKECVRGGLRDSERLSGFSVHTKNGAYGGLEVNGKQEESHEPFVLREHFVENIDSGDNFCKTARKPYDTVVVACLLILKKHLGDAFNASSDGFATDWQAGSAFAAKVLRRKGYLSKVNLVDVRQPRFTELVLKLVVAGKR